MKVLVSGCFDLLHSGHVAFLEEAGRLGDQLFVCIGSDETVAALKGRRPVCSQAERKFMLSALRSVHEVRISKGSGMLDFLPEMDEIRPDLLVVNEDGHTPEKAELCRKRGIDYQILRRLPHADLPARSSTNLRPVSSMPFRIDLCGGWLDQPIVNRFWPGAVINASLEPTIEFNDRSGMSSSTRKNAMRLWGNHLPDGDPIENGRVLFAFDNPPGTKDIAGSQDSLGITCPGLNRLDYADGGWWPIKIESRHDEASLQFIENQVFLINLGPRHQKYSVTDHTDITAEKAQKLAIAADLFWAGCLEKDLEKLGRGMRDCAAAQWSMFPNMVFDGLPELVESFKKQGALGWKLSGAGGGGYLILVAEKPPEGAISVRIRRKMASF